MRSKSRSLFWQKIALHAALTPLAIIWLFPLWMMFVFSTIDWLTGVIHDFDFRTLENNCLAIAYQTHSSLKADRVLEVDPYHWVWSR